MLLMLIRLALILAPLLMVVMWLKWRMKKDRTQAELDQDIVVLRQRLMILIGVMLAAILGLYLLDDRRGDADMIYVPARVENGKLIPGEYQPKPRKNEQDGGIDD